MHPVARKYREESKLKARLFQVANRSSWRCRPWLYKLDIPTNIQYQVNSQISINVYSQKRRIKTGV